MSADLHVTVDHASYEVAEGTTAGAAFTAAGIKGAVAARVNDGDALRDVAYVVAEGDVLESIAIDSPEGRQILRHSTAHVMAQAVQDLFPGTLLGIGPPIDRTGSTTTSLPEKPFTNDDLAAIEKRMSDIVAAAAAGSAVGGSSATPMPCIEHGEGAFQARAHRPQGRWRHRGGCRTPGRLTPLTLA